MSSRQNRSSYSDNQSKALTTTRRRTSGFLLFEVMVAVVVLSVGIAVVLRTFHSGLNGIRRIEYRATAQMRLAEKSDELQRYGLLVAGQTKGVFADSPDMIWNVNALSWEEDPAVFLAEVSVLWKEGEMERRLQAAILAPRRRSAALP